jgi:AMP deaminase
MGIKTFEEVLISKLISHIDIFQPLFEVTLDPESHPELSKFLEEVVAIDSVDDESVYEEEAPDALPEFYHEKSNPCYTYYMYFMWANIYCLNKLRESKGLHVFPFRPHCGESGSRDHLADAFLVAKSINHGINLDNAPVLQYLYYLEQIGLSGK